MSKDLFLKEVQLASAWRSIAGGENFQKVLTYARSQIAQQGPTREELRGVELLAHTLLNIAEPEFSEFSFPSPGIIHERETMPEDPRDAKQKPRKKRK